MKEFKNNVQSELILALSSKIEDLKSSLMDLKKAGESETKSSAGDKYETGREMIKQERGKYEQVLQEYEKQLAIIRNFNTEKIYHKAVPGSLVVTNKMICYIAIPYGKINVGEKDVFVISPSSPVAQLLLQKSIGDHYTLNGQKVMILEIF